MNHANRDVESRTPGPAGWNRLLLAALSLVVGTAIWLPAVHLCFRPWHVPPGGEAPASPLAEKLAARHVHLWTDPERRRRELDKMRATNAEWDFMGRSFLVWALANTCLGEPARKEAYLPVIDRIIDETLRLEKEEGPYHFLMPYARGRPFVVEPPRSQFLDGEIALMLAMRRLVEEKEDYRRPLRERVEIMLQRMNASPVLCAESYPDECWIFCNAVALAAIRVSDRLDGTDHSEFFGRWMDTAKSKLVDRQTGLLLSSFTVEGRPLDGPEGSSLWMSAHCLELIDASFARDQYRLARRELGERVCGFGFAREWPRSWPSPPDVDSGPVIPLLDASASSSGLALVGSRAFDDADYFASLLTTLNFAGFPHEEHGRRRYAAGNQVGDAVLLYAMVLGPAWTEVEKGTAR